jgi:hypothetical protein
LINLNAQLLQAWPLQHATRTPRYGHKKIAFQELKTTHNVSMQKTRLIPGQIDHIFVGQLRLDLLVTTLPTINNVFHVNTIRCIHKVFLFQKLHVLEQQKYQHSQ